MPFVIIGGAVLLLGALLLSSGKKTAATKPAAQSNIPQQAIGGIASFLLNGTEGSVSNNSTGLASIAGKSGGAAVAPARNPTTQSTQNPDDADSTEDDGLDDGTGADALTFADDPTEDDSAFSSDDGSF